MSRPPAYFQSTTNVVSEIRRGGDQHVRAWLSEVHGIDLHLKVLTLGEIRKGIELLRDRNPSQAEVFAGWLGELRTRFADRIVSIDNRVAEEWGRLNAAARRNTVDSLIAATASIHGFTVVTRNTVDFEGCGVPLLNPGSIGLTFPAERTLAIAIRRLGGARRAWNCCPWRWWPTCQLVGCPRIGDDGRGVCGPAGPVRIPRGWRVGNGRDRRV